MNIVYISNSSIPSKHANAVHVMKMAQAFSDNGQDTTLISKYGDKNISINVSDYEFYGVKNNFNIIKLPWIKKIGSVTYSIISLFEIIKLKPDFVYGRSLIAIYFSSLVGYKTMYEAHAPSYEENIIKRFFFKKLIAHKNFKNLVVISDALKNIFLDTEKLTKEDIFVAHDGSDIVGLEEKINLSSNNKLQVGYVGHLYKGRGIDIIIELSNILNDIDFHVVGGNTSDINYWKSQVKNDNIVFHGHVAPSEVYKYRNSFDILLAPYQNKVSIEGKNDTSKFMSPLKIFEYMSSKKAIISSDLPVLREILDENNSILVKCNDVQSWVFAIDKLREAENRKILSNNAYEDFKSKYTWKIRANNILKRF